ncbi:MAG: glycosyltransferase [Candidatus Brocadiales bacterium]|nr:glycosyltransferase [Candidatus Brocadiales bacterium]
MRIAFIVSKFPALSQTFILNQITGLIDRGHRVDIFAVQSDNNPKIHPDVTQYNLLNHTYYFRELPSGTLRRYIEITGLIIKYFYKKPRSLLKTWRLSRRGKGSILKILCAGFPFLDKYPYDIIHCHFGPNGILGILLKDLGVIKGKVVATFHGYDMSSYIQKHGAGVYKNLFLKGDLFLPVSERWENKLMELGCSHQKIIVHRMGINTSKFCFSTHTPGKDGKVRLLTIARLIEKKGVQYAVQAVAEALSKYPNIEYSIAGDGPLKITLEGLIERLNIGDNVKLLGWKQQEEIVELLKNADILIAPSIVGENGDEEGIPVVLMEALAQGIPVLSTQHSGIPELVQNGESGFLVPERNTDALAGKLEILIKHPEMRLQMGRAGREYVERYYNIDKLNDKLSELFQLLLNGTPGAL